MFINIFIFICPKTVLVLDIMPAVCSSKCYLSQHCTCLGYRASSVFLKVKTNCFVDSDLGLVCLSGDPAGVLRCQFMHNYILMQRKLMCIKLRLIVRPTSERQNNLHSIIIFVVIVNMILATLTLINLRVTIWSPGWQRVTHVFTWNTQTRQIVFTTYY